MFNPFDARAEICDACDCKSAISTKGARLMTPPRITAAVFAMALSLIAPVHADADLQQRVATALSQDGGWDQSGAELIAEELELSFALHESTGTLDQRIRALRRLNGMVDAQMLAVGQPGYLDAFLLEPELFTSAFQRLGLDSIGEEQLLAALLVRPTAEGLHDSAKLLNRFGTDLARLAPEPGFADFFEALSWVADDAPPDLMNWLGSRLQELQPDDLVMMTELLVTHRLPLQDFQNAAHLEGAWNVLHQVRQTDPALFNLLLSHRDIWSTATTPDLVRAIQTQQKRDAKHARNVLVLLLGSNGAFYEVSESLQWDQPLSGDNLKTAISILIADEDATMAAMFQFRDNAAFWKFAGDQETRALLPCLVKKATDAKQNLSAIEAEFQVKPSALAFKCKPEDSAWVRMAPFYSIYKIRQKYVAGAPIDLGDVGGAGFDLATTLIPVGKALGIGGRAGLGLRLSRIPTTANKATKVTTLTAKASGTLTTGFGTTVAEVLEAEAKRVMTAGLTSGTGQALRMGHEALTKTMAANPRMSTLTRELIEDYSVSVGFELTANTLSTEFLRCSSQPVRQMEEDRLCQDIVPIFVIPTNPEEAP